MHTVIIYMKSGRKFVFRFVRIATFDKTATAILSLNVKQHSFVRFIPFCSVDMRFISISEIEAVVFK